jgi:predicted membrane channel-forming protein YqfA (hemolysin III family)
LFQIRYFEPRQSDTEKRDLPDPRLRLLVAVILGATVFGSLDAILHRGGREVAIAVVIGVALSVLPILTRVLPPLVGEALPDGRRSTSAVTATGLVLYVVAVIGLVVVLNR